jgi:hypothetical protein
VAHEALKRFKASYCLESHARLPAIHVRVHVHAGQALTLSTISCASAAVHATGFSTSTCLPASIASRACSL